MIEVLTGAAHTRHIQGEIMVVSGKIVDIYFKQLPVSPINQPRLVMETLQLLSFAAKHSYQSRHHEWALAGLTLPNKAPSPPKLKHDILQNIIFAFKPLCINVTHQALVKCWAIRQLVQLHVALLRTYYGEPNNTMSSVALNYQ